jgi:hypothetical protein
MAEQTSTAAIDIFEPKDSASVNHVYTVRVLKADGSPLSGGEIGLSLEGSGSLASQFSSVSAKRELDANGETQAGWYRRSIWGRDLRARLTVSVEAEGAQISFEEFSPEISRTSYNLPKRPLRF